MKFYKKKKFYIIVVIAVLFIGGIAYGQYNKANKPVEYEIAVAKKGNLTRTVDATGKVQSTNDLSLRFETSGRVSSVNIVEGVEVKKGQTLAYLNLSELNASVAQAKANLDKQLAGSTNEELNSLKAAADNAKATWNKAKADAASSVATAESALSTAKNNLKLAEGGDNSQIVNDEYKDAVAVLQKSISVLNDGLNEADNILGIDNKSGNDDFEEYLSITDSTKLATAINYYPVAKSSNQNAKNTVLPLTTASSRTSIDLALTQVESALSNMIQLLSNVSDIFASTVALGDFTQAELNTLISNVSTDRSAVTTQYTVAITQKQDIANSKNSYTTYKIAYDKAVTDLSLAKQQATASLNIYKASYDQAQANYQNKVNPPREVDVASYRASLAQAVANRNKAVIISPMDGKIVRINKKVGEYISASENMFELSAPHFEIEVDIPETDIAKVKPSSEVIYSLDAFGDDLKFKSKVSTIDPKSTEIQDVVYYQLKINVDKKYMLDNNMKEFADKIKPGMTANVVINTADNSDFTNALYIPLRSVLTNKDGKKYVRVLKDNKTQDVVIVVGQRADNGQVIIKKGIKEGDEIVLRVKK